MVSLVTGSDRPGGDEPAPGAGDLIQAEFDWSSTSPCAAVIELVAIASDCEPTAIEPLYESVDPDALDALVRSKGARSTERDATVSFAFAGHDVTVRSTGVVAVRPVTD